MLLRIYYYANNNKMRIARFGADSSAAGPWGDCPLPQYVKIPIWDMPAGKQRASAFASPKKGAMPPLGLTNK